MKTKESFNRSCSSTVNGGMLLIFLVIAFIVYCSFPSSGEEYIKLIGGNTDEFGQCIKFDKGTSGKDNLIIVGSKKGFDVGGRDALITKLKRQSTGSSFVHDWTKHIGKARMDVAFSVAIDQQGYYVLCGYVSQSASNLDILLAKFSKDGMQKFARTYDVKENMQRDLAQELIVDKNNNYVIVGSTCSADLRQDILVAKFSKDGTFITGKIIGIEGVTDGGTTIIQDSMNNYVVVGFSDRKIVLVKLNPDCLQTLNTKRIFLPTCDYSLASTIVDDPVSTSTTPTCFSQKYYVLAGRVKCYNQQNPRLFIFKINYDLSCFAWAYALTPDSVHGFNCIELAASMIKTPGGDFVVSGFSQSPPQSHSLSTRAIFASFDGDGSLNWTKTMASISGPTQAYYKINKALSITLYPHPIQPLKKLYLATGYTSKSHYGGSDILAVSFDDNSTECFKKEERDVFQIYRYLTPYVTGEVFNNVSLSNIESGDVTLQVKTVCSQ